MTLLTFGLAAAGAMAFFKLPVSRFPQVDFPTISVQAILPGASPQDVAITVASPLERHLGQIADITEKANIAGMGLTPSGAMARGAAPSAGILLVRPSAVGRFTTTIAGAF